MPTDAFTADALAIKDAGGPWPFHEHNSAQWLGSVGMTEREQQAFLYACVEWLVTQRDVFGITRHSKCVSVSCVNDKHHHSAPTLPEAIIAAVKAELGIA